MKRQHKTKLPQRHSSPERRPLAHTSQMELSKLKKFAARWSVTNSLTQRTFSRKRTFTKTGDLAEPIPSRKPLMVSNRMPRMPAVLLPMKETAAMWRALSCRTARSSAGTALMAKAGVAPAGISSRKKRRGWPSAGKPKKSLELTLEILPILVTVKENQKKSLPVQIYRVNDYAGIPVCDQEEMFTATWFTPEQILAQRGPRRAGVRPIPQERGRIS